MNISGILLAGMIGLFSLAIGFILIFMYYQRRMIARDLQQQKLETDHQKKLLQAIIDNQEAERKRIAYDLHDEIGTLLTTSRLYFNQLSPGQTEAQLEVVSTRINLLFDEMMSNIRRISHDLRPVVLENLGLVEAIENIRHKLIAARIDFNFTCDLPFPLTRDAELIFYRIFQELVSNTLKHAHASRIDLTIGEEGDHMCMNYTDNGIGFNTTRNGGLGLKSIESRLSLLGTSMQVSNMERGARFLIRVPLTNIVKHEEH